MITNFPKSHLHQPQYFLIDATGKTLGRLATEVSKLLRGKELSYYTPGIDQGNFVMIINSEKIEISGKKKLNKIYYSTSQRPGGLKTETFRDLNKRLPSRIIEKAIFGMLPKGVLGRTYYRRLYVYSGNQALLKKESNDNIIWTKISL
jgi:large subunit ribosomal protein L13